MSNKNRQYTPEFKKEASRLIIIEGLKVSEVSTKLGVNAGLLYKWRNQHLSELGGLPTESKDMSPADMAAELDRVRKQLAREKRINEILKKTVGYFAKEEQ